MLTTFILILHFTNGAPDMIGVVGPIPAAQCIPMTDAGVQYDCVTSATVLATITQNTCILRADLAPELSAFPTATIGATYACNQ